MSESKIQFTQVSKDQSDPKERRIVPRTEVSAALPYQVLGGENPDEVYQGHLVDLSIAGAAFSSEQELPLETLVRLHVPASESEAERPGVGGARLIKGTIVNRRQVDGGDWRYGVKFERLFYTLAGLVSSLAQDYNRRMGNGDSAPPTTRTFDI